MFKKTIQTITLALMLTAPGMLRAQEAETGKMTITVAATPAAIDTQTTASQDITSAVVYGEPTGGWASVECLGQRGVTGGAGGEVVTVTTLAEFEDYAARAEPYVIQVKGTIGGAHESSVKSDKTIIGFGDDAVLTGGLVLRDCQNVIVKNLNLCNGPEDAIKILENAHNIWIDHCDFQNFAARAFDIVRASNAVTISWCRFGNLEHVINIGNSDMDAPDDAGRLNVTLHHNWFQATTKSLTRARFSKLMHAYNNYYDNVADAGAESNCDAGVFMENNYFENVKTPFKIGTKSVPTGRLAERGNVFANCGERRPTGGVVADPASCYAYMADPADKVPELVKAGAGPRK